VGGNHSQVGQLISEFREYLKTEEAREHLKHLREKEPKETREILSKLKTLPRDSKEFTDLVLCGLLPHYNTKYAKRVSIAPAFMNVRKFFARFGYSENDWNELANIVFDLVVKFESAPERLEEHIRDFTSNRLSKALQCGAISPIFFALNQNYPMITNKITTTYRRLSFIVFGQADDLNNKLEYYPANVKKIKRLIGKLVEDYGFKEIEDIAVFDLFCFWYAVYKADETVLPIKKRRATPQEEETPPIDEKYVTKFLQTLACSPPQPFQVEALEKLDSENRIIYNAEFQRGEVWNIHKKQKLIDSILRGYNINTVFLRQRGDGKYECLDGQQRLKAILRGFLKNKFPINPRITPEFNREAYFDELPDTLKSKIKSYLIYAIVFYTDDDEETCKIFLRLQEGVPLNSAEKLNAMTGFLRNEIVELSRHPVLKKSGIRDYRFSHRYILAQAYLLTLRNQITDVKFRDLQEMYVTYGTVRPPQTVTNTVETVLNFLDREFGEDARIIKYNSDFISLYLLAKYLVENYAFDSKIGLKDFFLDFLVRVSKAESSENESDAPYLDYATYRKTSADSRNSIKKRFDVILSKFLEFNQALIPKDSNRSFNYWEKLAVYHRDRGICQICGRKTPFGEGTVDHKIPYSRGGKTTIENGQWACIECNLKKSNKIVQ